MSVNTISIVRAVILFASAKNLDCSSGDENMTTVAATLDANQWVVGRWVENCFLLELFSLSTCPKHSFSLPMQPGY